MATDTSPAQLDSPSLPEPRPRSHAKTVFLLLGFIAAAVAVVMWLHSRGREATDDAQIAGHMEPVSPRIPGVVVEVDVNDNQIVTAGQVLFRLDPSDYEQALAQAKAALNTATAASSGAGTGVPIIEASSTSNLSQAQAALQEAQAGEQLASRQLAAAEAQLQAARAQQSAAQANADNATSTEKRFSALVAKDEISQLQFDQITTQAKAATATAAAAAAQVETAQQQVASANASIEVARAKEAQAAAAVRAAATAPQQLQVSRAQFQAAQARVAQAQAAVAEAELNLGYTVVRAPSGGQVGNKNIEVGQAFAPGQTALDIVPINDVWVIANFKETQLRQMRSGQRAEVSVDAFGQKLRAQVNSLGAATGAAFSLLPPENATGNYVKVVQRVPVKLVFEPNQDLSRLRPGMSVEATVFTQ